MDFCIKNDPDTSLPYAAVKVKGKALLINPFTNKGTAFTARERQDLELEGLLPPIEFTIEQQRARAYESFQSKATDLERFIYLTSLQDRNETLFFRLVQDHIDEMMPIVYTPVVGEACQKFSQIYRRGRGLYVDYNQRDRIEEVLANYHTEDPSVIVVTDGERILGLGDQGAGGMGIPIGKLCLYTLCAGISPYDTLPIMLDVGTDNEERLANPLYLGLRQKRVRGKAYQDFIDQFVAAVKHVYPNVLLQWEDFLKGNALKQLHRFRDELCTFNDDIQGTAGVILSGIYCALRITGQPMIEQRVLFAGAGASAQGISDLIVTAMVDEGLSRDVAQERIWTVDSKGLVVQGRPGLDDFKKTYARSPAEVAQYDCRNRERISLEEAVLNARPTILIGSSGTPGTFTQEVVEAMARINKRPIIFPISNPTSKTECTPEDGIRWSEGRAIMATGSPFDPVEYNGQRHRIGQGNNAYLFPGVGLGVTVSRSRRVTDGMFLDAAKALAGLVTEEDLAECAVYPQLTRIRECSAAVACATVRRAVTDGHAEAALLDGLEQRVEQAMWQPEYLPYRLEP
ncbi:MAG: NAD-dependent malic enzyme [Deltaproteobacteria bacterium]|nr:MAG: NAD-dependent malic enzyme [Deltaproteobacteria bacterium]